MDGTLLSVGHSSHALDAFVALLQAAQVEQVADVRRWPRSHRHPHFDDDALAVELAPRGIAYAHFPELGGHPTPVADSPNTGWEEEAFRGYADHLASAELAQGVERLEALARRRQTAVMCAEGGWERCHRRLLCDLLVVRGWDVHHLGPDGTVEPHRRTPFAVVDDGVLRYPAAQLGFGL